LHAATEYDIAMKLGQGVGRHLEDAELEQERAECPVCGARDRRPRVFLVQPDPDVHLLRCPRCHACSASRMPRPEVLDDFYRDYYERRGSEHQFVFAAPARFARHVLRRLPAAAFGDVVRILDFGGGDGTLSKTFGEELLAADRGRRIEITLVDFNDPVAAGDPRIALQHQRPGTPIEGSFDLVLASGVLEHIVDARAAIDTLYAALNPGGFFYARTPYMMPFTHLFRRLDITFPNHVHDMGSPFWNRFAATFGWDVRVLRSAPSIVESGFLRAPVRTLAAFALKLPAHVERLLSPARRVRRLWHLVAGWEVIFQKRG